MESAQSRAPSRFQRSHRACRSPQPSATFKLRVRRRRLPPVAPLRFEDGDNQRQSATEFREKFAARRIIPMRRSIKLPFSGVNNNSQLKHQINRGRADGPIWWLNRKSFPIDLFVVCFGNDFWYFETSVQADRERMRERHTHTHTNHKLRSFRPWKLSTRATEPEQEKLRPANWPSDQIWATGAETQPLRLRFLNR